MASPIKLQTGFQFLTKTSWDSRWLASARRVTARDQLSRRDTQHTGDGRTCCYPGIWAAGTGEMIRRTRLPPGESALAKHLIAWTARTGGLRSAGPTLQSNLEPVQCRLGKHTGPERGQTQCGRDTASTPHAHQWYVFAVFLPPHNRTEQVSLNKWPPLPMCQGGH